MRDRSDRSHPTGDIAASQPQTPITTGLYLVPEIHAAAKAAGFHEPLSVLQFAERTCHYEVGTLASLGHLSEQEQQIVLFALHELAEGGEEAAS
jgi:hypothetical protein